MNRICIDALIKLRIKMFNFRNELKKAWKEKRAIGAFNVFDLESAQAVAEAARETDYPVIMQITPKAVEYAGLKQIFDIAKNEIHENNIKAAIHLDHGKDFGIEKACVDQGFDSVMIDGSKLDFEANVAITSKVVHYAKKYDTVVEGEIGVISREEGGMLSGTAEFTKPEVVRDFALKSGVDILAVSVGNEHGAPAGEQVNEKLLSEIAAVTTVPLVMHGASGLAKKDLRIAMRHGVVKVNIDTNIRKIFVDQFSREHPGVKDPREILILAKEAAKKLIIDYIGIFSGRK